MGMATPTSTRTLLIEAVHPKRAPRFLYRCRGCCERHGGERRRDSACGVGLASATIVADASSARFTDESTANGSGMRDATSDRGTPSAGLALAPGYLIVFRTC